MTKAAGSETATESWQVAIRPATGQRLEAASPTMPPRAEPTAVPRPQRATT
jgi:hypothetical protein